MVKFISAFICPVVYIGKGIGCVSGASVEESMRTAVRLLKAADLTDLNLGLAWSLHGDLKWCGVHSNGRAVVKDLTRRGSRPNDRYIKPECLYLYRLLTLLIWLAVFSLPVDRHQRQYFKNCCCCRRFPLYSESLISS